MSMTISVNLYIDGADSNNHTISGAGFQQPQLTNIKELYIRRSRNELYIRRLRRSKFSGFIPSKGKKKKREREERKKKEERK